MYWGSSATSVLVGVVGGVLIVAAVLLGRRLGGRRAVGVGGLGLLLLGLTLSGLIDLLARIAFDPLRWVGLAAVVVGFVLMFGSGLVPGRGRRPTAPAKQSEPVEAAGRRSSEGTSDPDTPAVGDGEMDEIEEILRRRGIT